MAKITMESNGAIKVEIKNEDPAILEVILEILHS
jgi:hypothetical protein